jgi:hypothetical protein
VWVAPVAEGTANETGQGIVVLGVYTPSAEALCMTELLRRFRGAGIALVVLAISAGAAFAAAPRFHPVSETTTVETTDTSETSETAETSETTETTVTTETNETTASTTDTTETTETTQTTEIDDSSTSEADDADGHGALVSFAAHQPLDPRFRNRGAWMSCVAKLGADVTLANVDWAQVTEDCVAAQATKDAKRSGASGDKASGKAHAKGAGSQKGHGKPKG